MSPHPDNMQRDYSLRDQTQHEQSYAVEIRENDRRLSIEPLTDPFINTTIHPRGWRVALAVLRRRYKITVIVGGDCERVEEVLKLDPDYLGPHNHKEFMEGALGDFAARIVEHEDGP